MFQGHTNESLWAIVKGLQPTAQDRILSICGSADQPFALLEYASKVHAIDQDGTQIDYALRRKAALQAGRFAEFFPLPKSSDSLQIPPDHEVAELLPWQVLGLVQIIGAMHSSERNFASYGASLHYFLGEDLPTWGGLPYYWGGIDRLERIAKKSKDISFEEIGLSQMLGKDANFTKVYLSNALGFGNMSRESVEELWERLENLPKGCIIYVASMEKKAQKVPPSWREVKPLSRYAAERESPNSWTPRVYQKKR